MHQIPLRVTLAHVGTIATHVSYRDITAGDTETSKEAEMLKFFVPAVALGLALSGTAFAQSSTTTSTTPGSQATAPSGSSSNTSGMNKQNVVTANKLKQDLQSAGFSDVTVVPEAFVVRAKTKDGNPVVMTIGPHGFTAFEAMGRSNPQTGSTGSAGGSSSGSSSSGRSTSNQDG